MAGVRLTGSSPKLPGKVGGAPVMVGAVPHAIGEEASPQTTEIYEQARLIILTYLTPVLEQRPSDPKTALVKALAKGMAKNTLAPDLRQSRVEAHARGSVYGGV